MQLNFEILVQEWARAISENIKSNKTNWAVYVSTTGQIQARPQDDKNWALFLKANAWNATTPGDPNMLVRQSDIRTQLDNDYHEIIRF